MLYREAGQFHTTYRADQRIFPILQDRVAVVVALAVAFVVIPMIANEYWLQAILIPFLILALASVGLNILTGYAGQLSLGTGGFMAVGAYATYKMTTAFPEANIILLILASGLFAAGVGILFGIPSLRIKGFYLAVATLAAQFFLIWLFNRVPWFYNYAPSGTITAPPRTFFGVMVTGPEASPEARYLVCLALLAVLGLLAKNMVRSNVGRAWMAVRDMDVAAEIIGIRPFRVKLLAFAISSYYCGVAGALYMFAYLGSVETIAYDITLSFLVLFMIIIGGLGSILGSILGAFFITTVPIILTNIPVALDLPISVETSKHIELMIFGGLIVFFLIAEPLGLARLWQIGKEKLRLWPFPH